MYDDIYGSVENDLITPKIAFGKSIVIDGGIKSDIAVLGNDTYKLIVRTEGIFARMPCNYNDEGEFLEEPEIREYNLAAIIEAIQEINRRTAWMETDMSLFDSLEYTDVLYDKDNNKTIDQDGPLYDTLPDLLPALKDPLVYSAALVDQRGRKINYPIEDSKAVNDILNDMINNGVKSKELTAKEIEDIFFMVSAFSVRGVKATIEPQTALLIPHAKLVNRKVLQIKIYIDNNANNLSKPHEYEDDIYKYTYYELGDETINTSLGREINAPFILISLKDHDTEPTHKFITDPYILILNVDIDHKTLIYQMINVREAIINCVLVLDDNLYDAISSVKPEWVDNTLHLQ